MWVNRHSSFSDRQNQRGFTIVELLIVIVVIGILAAITIVAYNGIQQRARDARVDAALTQVKSTIEMYKIDNGSYPNVCGGADIGCSFSSLSSALVPTYISALPTIAGLSQYVTGSAASNSYAILVSYEAKPQCKTGNNVNGNWWGVPGSPPTC